MAVASDAVASTLAAMLTGAMLTCSQWTPGGPRRYTLKTMTPHERITERRITEGTINKLVAAGWLDTRALKGVWEHDLRQCELYLTDAGIRRASDPPPRTRHAPA